MSVKYPRAKPYFSQSDQEEILDEIGKILQSGMLTQGFHVKDFEDAFARKIGSQYAIATSNCTSALQMAIEALKIKGKRILVPTQTWMSSVNAIILSGNTPVIVDIDPDTMCIDTDIIRYEYKQDPDCAVLWVHMAGQISPDILEIKKLGIPIIEDCAHAHGASIFDHDKQEWIMAGNIGDAGCFSFYPTKVLATGEGGMITTNSKEVDVICRILRDHGTKRNDTRDGLDAGVTVYKPSQNFRMTEMSAIMGKTQLKRLDGFVEKRNQIANWYRVLLDDTPGIKLLPKQDFTRHSYWNFYIVLDETVDRYKFAFKLLHEHGVQTANAYVPPCHKQDAYKEYLRPSYQVADNVLNRHISLPLYVELTEADCRYITDSIKKVLNV